MTSMLCITQHIIEEGLLFALIVAAVFLTSHVIKFNNLSIDGAFGLGGALTALLINWHINPWLCLIVALIMSGFTGIFTALIHTKLELNRLMSGIVVSMGLYSVSQKIAGNHMPLKANQTIFHYMPMCLKPFHALTFLIIICLLIFMLINWFLKTGVGRTLHILGQAPHTLINMEKNVEHYTIAILVISNALAGLSGALFVQYAEQFSIQATTGVLIAGFSCLILTQTYSQKFGIVLLIGAILYKAIMISSSALFSDETWSKLYAATSMLIIVAINQRKRKK